MLKVLIFLYESDSFISISLVENIITLILFFLQYSNCLIREISRKEFKVFLKLIFGLNNINISVFFELNLLVKNKSFNLSLIISEKVKNLKFLLLNLLLNRSIQSSSELPFIYIKF